MTLGLLIFLSYSVLAFNTRAIAKGDYVSIGVSCVGFMMVNFFLTHGIVEAKPWTGDFYWYITGGVVGEIFGVYLSHRFEQRKNNRELV